MLAAKTYDDFYYSNAVWAKVCGREALVTALNRVIVAYECVIRECVNLKP